MHQLCLILVELLAGDMLLQQMAAILLSSAAQADAKELADISAGLTELQILGYGVTSQHVEQVHSRSRHLTQTLLASH